MIKNIAALRKIIPTIATNDITRYWQDINNATAWLKNNIVGTPLMKKILELKDQEPEHELCMLARMAVGYRAYQTSIAQNNVVETPRGFGIVNDDKVVPASTARVQDLERAMTDHLNETIGRIIEYLEDSPEFHSAWSSSPTFSIMYGSYIPTLRMFRQYGQFTGSYVNFIDALPTIRGIIMANIEPRISRELSAAIITQVRNKSLSEANRRIIHDLRSALAAYYNENPALGNTCIRNVRLKLEADPDSYPEFKASELYKILTAQREEKEKYKSLGLLI